MSCFHLLGAAPPPRSDTCPDAECLFGERTGAGCFVCQTVVRWKNDGYRCVMLLQPPASTSKLVFKPLRAMPAVGTRRPGCVLALPLDGAAAGDTRLCLNSALGSALEIWIDGKLLERDPAARQYSPDPYPPGRRRHARRHRPSLVRLNSTEGMRAQIAVVENDSEGGLHVSAKFGHPVGQAVTVQSRSGLQAGVVRHCSVRPQDGYYSMGIEYV